MDFETSLRRAIKTGKVLFGQKATMTSIQEGISQMVVVADNCPEEFKTYLFEQEDVFVHIYSGSGVQLGKACGQPFMVSALSIVDAGESDILTFKRT
jgi:large subunit ribosomal protein L30e